jgi:zinc/manganese transport system permease protein
VIFLVVLAATAAEVSQITGALLVFALLVLPPATAQAISPRLSISLAISVAIGLVTVWVSLFIAYYSRYPVGFWLTSIGFGIYVVARAAIAMAARLRIAHPEPATVPIC